MSDLWFFIRCVLVLLAFVFSIIIFEGCAGQGKQELWEGCANVVYEECQRAEDWKECMYFHYLECIDEGEHWSQCCYESAFNYGGNVYHDGII